MYVMVTLGDGLGNNLGTNFVLSANIGIVTPSVATKSELLAGKVVSVENTATRITVTSLGTCTNSLNITIAS